MIYPGRRPKTWRVVIWARGKSHEWVFEGRHKDAETFQATKRLELDAGRETSKRGVPSFAGFCASKYAPHAKKHLRDSTWEKVRVYQVATLCKHLGALKLTEINAEEIERFKRERSESMTRAGRKVKASSINNELRVLRTIRNWAITLGHALPPLEIKKLPTRGSGRVRVWSSEQLGRLFEAARADATDLLPVLVFLVNTGCRKGEAIAAEWDWIDDAKGMVRIPVNEFWRPKNGMPREIPISDALRATLSGAHKHARWLFPTIHGGRYAEFPKDVYNRVREAAELVGGPHTTRHTFASHFLGSCPDMFLLAQVLGHSHQRVTELYSHLLPEHLSRARNAVNIGPAIKTMAATMAAKKESR